MRKLPLLFLLAVLFLVIAFASLSHSKTTKRVTALPGPKSAAVYKAPSNEFLKLKSKAAAVKLFVKQNHFDTSYYFFINMSLPANHKRFFIYDLQRNAILNSGLVTHGNCNQYWLRERKYGNEIGCGCTSLGKYKIGISYQGKFGLAFKLHGLEETNSNAYKRYVVLHSHGCVPNTEVRDEICQSNGCPTVAPEFLKQLEVLIKELNRPPLLWIFE